MNDFNDFQDEDQIEYGDSRRSTGVSIGILIVTLLTIGFVWLVLRGSIPGLSPDFAIATQYEDTFLFERHARYNLLVANLGQAPSISRLTVMSTLSETAIPETVYAPAPWSCTLQAHSVTCETSGIVTGGDSLPPIEITALVSPRAADGSADNLRICAAVETLLDSTLDNNETCEILTLQVAEADSISPMVDDANIDTLPDESDSITQTITQTVEGDDTVVSEALEPTEAVTETTAPMVGDANMDTLPDESDSITQAITQTVEGDDTVVSETLEPTEAVTETIAPMVGDANIDTLPDESDSITQAITQTVEGDDTVVSETLEPTEAVTETTAPMVGDANMDTLPDESDSITQTVTQTVEGDDTVVSETIDATETVTESTTDETIEPSNVGISETEVNQENEIVLLAGNRDGVSMTIPVDGKVLVPIHFLPTTTDAQITVATLQIQFDHTLLEPVTCNENPDQLWSISVCNLAYGSGLLRVSGLSMEGISEENRVANIEFQAIGPAGTASPIKIHVVNMVNRQQESVLYTVEDGEVVIE